MAVTVKNALSFIWSICPLVLVLSPSPGPGRISAQRTEQLHTETMIRGRNRKHKNAMVDMMLSCKTITQAHIQDSSQVRTTQPFLIMAPRRFWSPL